MIEIRERHREEHEHKVYELVTNFLLKNNMSSFLYNIPFIEIEGRSYAGAKRLVTAIIFRVVEWIDPRSSFDAVVTRVEYTWDAPRIRI